jgi:hypothetical protein
MNYMGLLYFFVLVFLLLDVHLIFELIDEKTAPCDCMGGYVCVNKKCERVKTNEPNSGMAYLSGDVK